jgi:hypothetical protein
LLLGVLAVSSVANAQKPFVFFGGGLTVPTGDFGNVAKTGWMGTGGIGIPAGTQGLVLAAEGYFGTNDWDPPTLAESTDLIAGLGTIGYSISQASKVHPYVLGGVGFLSAKTKTATTSTTETEFAFTGAAGLVFSLSPTVGLWVEGRYVHAGDTRFFPVLAGLYIQLGN